MGLRFTDDYEDKRMAKTKMDARRKRKHSIRKKVSGTAERPRLSVFRSLKQVYAQVIDDDVGYTLAAASSLEEPIGDGDKKARAAAVGRLIAERCQAKDIRRVVFDRNGYLYHGRVRAVAEAARKAGLEF